MQWVSEPGCKTVSVERQESGNDTRTSFQVCKVQRSRKVPCHTSPCTPAHRYTLRDNIPLWQEVVTQEVHAPHHRGQTTRARDEICTYCWKRGHGCSVPMWVQRKECPTYGRQCKLGSRDNHFEQVCRSKPTTWSKEYEDVIFDSLCTDTTYSRYHLYNQLTDTWMKQPSQPRPYIML